MTYTTGATARWEPPPPPSPTVRTTTVKRKREDDYDGRISSLSLSLERGYQRNNKGYTGNDLSFRTAMRVLVKYSGRDSRRLSRSYNSRSGVHRNDSWKCKECFAFNQSNQACCTRCSSKVPEAQHYRSSSVKAYPLSRSVVRTCRRHYNDRREREQQRDSKVAHDVMRSPKLEWPPSFESYGAAYVFDARSGFFYEAASDFFYDPKTKLYYGNKHRTYFTYAAGEEPPFRHYSNDTSGADKEKNLVLSKEKLLSCPIPTCSATSVTIASAAMTASEAGKTDKKKIDICFKKKSFGITATVATKSSGIGATSTTAAVKILSRSPKSDNNVKIANCFKKRKLAIAASVATKSCSGMEATPTKAAVKILCSSPPRPGNNVEEVSLAPLIRKRYTANMEMWSERVQEMKREVQLAETSVQPTVTQSSNDEEQPDATSNLVTTTTHGKPICLLCKRKFVNMEKLEQHIELSALHKQNVRKKAATDAKKELKTNYRDRAKERRAMYGSELFSIHEDDEPVIIAPSLTQARPVPVTEIVPPDQALGEANIGNKLLQKLGWKNNENESGNSQLKQDWKAIEAIASGTLNMGQTKEIGIGSSRRMHRF